MCKELKKSILRKEKLTCSDPGKANDMPLE
jgi:hypothetical protein